MFFVPRITDRPRDAILVGEVRGAAQRAGNGQRRVAGGGVEA
jgi:hypothetical protein